MQDCQWPVLNLILAAKSSELIRISWGQMDGNVDSEYNYYVVIFHRCKHENDFVKYQ